VTKLQRLVDVPPVGPSLEERAAWVQENEGSSHLEVPRQAETTYLTHGLFRYVGKLPPPLVAYFLDRYSSPGATVLDPMCGGGTTAIEAVTSGRPSINFDINPVARLVTEALTNPIDLGELSTFSQRVVEQAISEVPPPRLGEYFSEDAYGLIRYGLDLAQDPAQKALMLAIARKASRANTKKINTVVDPSKTPEDARKLLQDATEKFVRSFESLRATDPATCTVAPGRADEIPLEPESVDFVLLHPPYLTNTAFSEVTEIQLNLLGLDPKELRKAELAFRGSYFHVPNGLKKYLIGWARILQESSRVLRPGGVIAVVVGDGRIDNVRIPVGTITAEYAEDLDLKQLQRSVHVLNNQTGWTLSRRMTHQHVLVFGK